jgi:hypothetical protein
MLKKLIPSVFVILSIGFAIFNSNNISAQESSTPTSPGSSKKFPIAKQHDGSRRKAVSATSGSLSHSTNLTVIVQ